jgi:hypothetical protein
MKGDFIGFATIGASVGLLAWLVPVADVPRWVWPFAFVALWAAAWISWHHPKAAKTPKAWFRLIKEILVVTCILVPLHAVIWGYGRPGQVLIDASFFFSGMIVVAAGLARSLAHGEQAEPTR